MYNNLSMPDYSHITSKCFVNAPYSHLETGLLDLITGEKIQPEIGLEGDVLYRVSKKEFKKTAAILKENGLSCTLHAPFFELSPGALDEYILKASREKLRKAFELIPVFEPVSVVCHLNYEHHKHKYNLDSWLETSMETWGELLEIAARYNTPFMLENTFEPNPVIHEKILSGLNSDFARFCLDVGHTMAFANSTWQDWLPALEPWLGHIHLHDNDGAYDSHLAIGEGIFDFDGFFSYLKAKKLNPLITLEPHEEGGLWKSLETLDQMGFFEK